MNRPFTNFPGVRPAARSKRAIVRKSSLLINDCYNNNSCNSGSQLSSLRYCARNIPNITSIILIELLGNLLCIISGFDTDPCLLKCYASVTFYVAITVLSETLVVRLSRDHQELQ